MAIAQPYLTVLMPAYNEEAGLARSVELLRSCLLDRVISFEILIVNDASRDHTGEIANSLAARYADVRVVHHPENRGIGGGFVTGVADARGDWLILIPADLALQLAELPRYFDAAEDADVIVGIRSDRSDYSGYRLMVSWINIRLVQILFGMTERQFNYISMYRLAVLRQMRIEYSHSAFFHAEAIIKAKALGYRLTEVEISYTPRTSGRPTGARPKLLVSTVRDMLRFWVRWIVRGPTAAARA